MSGIVASLVALFPESHRSITDGSILGRAKEKGILTVEEVQIRAFAVDKHKTVDDSPAGGGPGMIMKVDVVSRAIDDAVARDVARGVDRRRRIILFDAAGPRFTQADAARFATYDHLVFVCGRYEGIDARITNHVDESMSIGDYVLTGGELAALVVLDATTRVLDGALGNPTSSVEESFSASRLEHRQYTRPVVFNGRAVPPVLLSGDHKRIARARQKDALERTAEFRPTLFHDLPMTASEKKIVDDTRIDALDTRDASVDGETTLGDETT